MDDNQDPASPLSRLAEWLTIAHVAFWIAFFVGLQPGSFGVIQRNSLI